jgi:hypothetical protein
MAPTNGSAAIPREAEPLMLRVLGAYYVTGDAPIRELRGRGWSFGDIATAGNLAARSGRPFYQIARAYEERRDWTMVASDVNVSTDEIYVAVNSPRYVMLRPTPEEEARIAAATPAPGEAYATAVTPETVPGAAAPDTAVAPGAVAPPGTPGAPNAAVPPTAVTPGAANAPPAAVTPGEGATPVAPDTGATPGAATPGAALSPEGSAVVGSPMPTRSSLTPVERVAASRLELAPRDQSAILRRAVATYYVLPASTVRDLEGRGWTLGDILVAGNLAYRSEATVEEIVALRDTGQDWSAIAGRIGVAPEDLYQPTMIRRVTTAP